MRIIIIATLIAIFCWINKPTKKKPRGRVNTLPKGFFDTTDILERWIEW